MGVLLVEKNCHPRPSGSEGKGTQVADTDAVFDAWVFVRWRYELPHIALVRDARRG
jgi:hypothetical protein